MHEESERCRDLATFIHTLSLKRRLAELLNEFLADVPWSTLPKRKRKADRNFKLVVKTSVRSVMNDLNEAEVTDDPRRVRKLLKVLSNRQKIPVKIFRFHEDLRPSYYGTLSNY